MSKPTMPSVGELDKKVKGRKRKTTGKKQRALAEHPSLYMTEQAHAGAVVRPDSPASDAVSTDADVVPYDENLLERARTQWQFGDWESLSRLERGTLQHHPDRAKLALLAAAGQLQINNTEAGKQFLRLARDWGCSKRLISQILVAGVHNSLGRAAAVVGQEARALEHFQSAIAVGTPSSDGRLITRARVAEQLTQLGLPVGSIQSLTAPFSKAFPRASCFEVARTQRPLVVTTLARHYLGEAWAPSTTHTRIARAYGIVTDGSRQYTAFYVNRNTLRVVQRDLLTAIIKIHDIAGDFNLGDAADGISLGIDRAGYLHMTYAQHTKHLGYRRTTASHDIDAWTPDLTLTGVDNGQIHSLTFILPHDNHLLTLLYGEGEHPLQAVRIKTYDETGQFWADHPEPILAGDQQPPEPGMAYWSRPAVGSDGSLHLSFCWPTPAPGEENAATDISLCYARSPDNGASWVTSLNRPCALPMTPFDAEVAHRLSPGSHLLHQSSLALDSSNRPHIVFCSAGPTDISRYQHLWFDGQSWRHQLLLRRTPVINRQSGDTRPSPGAPPKIVIDRQDNVYVIYRSDQNDKGLVVTRLLPPDYTAHSTSTQALWIADLGDAEPIIDSSRWLRDNVLTLLLQHNQQARSESEDEISAQPITLLDVIFN